MGLRNFALNKIFGLPLLIEANIEFFSYLFFCHNIAKFPPVMVNLLLDFTSAAFHLIA